ncbi:ATP-binding cassette domain-containing protein [Corynebacterium flavescens]|uniref:ABC transporter ATP-binding protein n=1 Tax=Corynebacterium flavescens TaxID=28028 RepID=A0A1L7CND2_CORFL|nr:MULTISPECIES: ABC transporter ATP-binding protein [Corynebacterium]APT87325.1 ABC transporter ATP-binding protein [Corynebacterium flavescens]KAA8721089.1 ABC transporter ATP-binding protein [Corynebacterium flavescens]MDN6099664.1 ABC transporter ATP-binding protein [Corynebacterium flavescens]MDN6198884.1 ABC transporter ATP-binding protein [Corynebacterium flavescens]MDN6226735.1 ABC transporter ATP-binding protein [Corynebacterium flavescens]
MSLLHVQDLRIGGLLGPLSFDLAPGDNLGIIGESGSGKSLTALSIMGLLPPQLRAQGSIALEERELIGLPDRRVRPLRGSEMAMVFQEPMSALDPLMRVGKQLELAGSNDRAASLREVGLDPALSPRYPHELSGGQRQRVLIAMAMARSPKLLICDEPTTALDATTEQEILDLIASLAAQKGTAVLFITHDLSVIARMCSRVLVLRQGQLIESGSTSEVLDNPQQDYTAQLIAASRPAAPAAPRPVGDPLVELDGVAKHFGTTHALDDVTFTLRRGERLGIVGGSGSGKTTTLKLIAGLDEPTSGTISVEGRVQVVFQDPQGSLDPRLPIWKTIAEGIPNTGKKLTSDRAKVSRLLEEVGLPADSLDRFPHEFSGGQRQRISIARAIIGEPDILLADEAVSALDVLVRAQVLALLDRLVENHGLSLIFISHDLAVVQQVCSSVLVINNGTIVERGNTADILGDPQHPYTQKLVAARQG